jgi:hypothetical protein
VAAAFAQPYGRAIAAEFSAALAETADPDCLKTKRFTKDQVPDRALAMLQKRGAYMLERADAMTDQARFKSFLRARIGANGMTEVERLRNDPLVRAYLAVDEPARLAYVAVAIVEQIQRYAMISRIKFARPFSPLDSDIPAIDKLDPIDKVDGTLKEMVANDKTGTLVRYLELVAMADKPLRDAINMDIAMKTGPGEFLAPPGKDRSDLQNELVELCVARPLVKD